MGLLHNRLRRHCGLVTAGLALLLLLGNSNLWSQNTTSTENMPPWTVLVLKLVSATHVQPTTGIVIAAPDLVLVAADFARVGDEIMVLDGGTDIVRHGLPANIVHTLPADKLAILKVQGLNRPAARLSAMSMASLQALNLVAFPPAEKIAQGAAPVRARVKTLAAITTAWPTLEPFPNVSAALTDDCDGLVAFNLSSGLQSMQPAGSPRLAWPDALKRAADLAGTAMQQIDCSDVQTPLQELAAEPTAVEEVEAADPKTEPKTVPEAQPTDETEASQPESPQESLQPEELAASKQAEPEMEEFEAATPPDLQYEPADAGVAATNNESFAQDIGPLRHISPAVWTFTGMVVLLLLAWWLHRRRQKPAGNSAAQISNQPARPGTVSFAATAYGPATVLLKVTVQRPEDKDFIRQLSVGGPGWMAELGRQEDDIDLDSPTVSRRHARLELYEGRITITDLDSTKGTRVNGVPCLPGEVFFVQADDVVELGDVKLSLQLTTGNDQ